MTARIATARAGTFSTNSVEHAEFVLSNTAVPYRSELVSGQEEFCTCISARAGTLTSISRARTRGRLRVHAAMPDNALAFVMSRAGVLPHVCAGEEVVVCKSVAFLHSAGEEVDVATPPEQELYFFRIEQGRITAELEKLLDHATSAPLKFKRKVRLDSSAGAEIARGVVHLYQTIEQMRDAGERGAARIAAMETHLMRLLLESQQHNYTRVLNRRAEIAPFQVRRAIEFIEMNAKKALTLGEIATAAGTNARTLQYSFQKTAGCSPLQYMKRFRMGKARDDLQRSGGEQTVTEIAARWGFFHFGRFALEYGKEYGERPSETTGKQKKAVPVA